MRYSKKYISSACLTCLLITALIMAAFRLPDTHIIQMVTSMLEKYRDYYRPDKVYLLTDKPYYTSGETIWLKVFQVEATSHIPHSRSRVVYVELLNANQQVVTSRKLRVENNSAAGDILLPADLPAGAYNLRAYTKWMLNRGEDFIFSAAIPVYQPEEPVADNTTRILPLANLQFFPEGGHLVNGLMSTVAFKAVDKEGKGVEVQGIVTGQHGDTLTTFQSLHLGMGAFRLQPKAGDNYKAMLITTTGDTVSYPLPAALADGWVMTTDNSSANDIKVHIQSAGDAPGQANVIAQVRGKVHFSATANVSGPAISIPKHSLPEGILHITAFDEAGNARCERLVFINHQHQLNIQVTAGKHTYHPREQVSLEITVQDKAGKPVAANLAMAVTDAGQIAYPKYGQNILTYLLLTSDLKGYIEQPGYYFSGEAKASQALDYLLMTQGWRRFTWKEVLQPVLPELKYEMENGLSLAGRLINAATKAPVPNQLVTLSVPGGNPAFYQEYSDTEGYFAFTDFYYYDDKDIFLRAVNQPDVYIQVDTAQAVQVPQLPIPAYPEEKIKSFIAKNSKRKKIEEAFMADEDNEEWQPAADGPQTMRTAVADVPADHYIEPDKYNPFPSMPETLKEIVPGIIIKDKKGMYRLRVLDINRKLYFRQEPVYFIDGILYTTNEAFLKLDPSSVQAIEVYGRPEKLARFGSFGRNGVIAAYTRNGDFYPADLPNLLRIPYRGLYQSREFYTPVYDAKNTLPQKPDLRSLIYWNPTVTTDAGGKAQVTFYNPDNIGKYTIYVEGISAGGIPGVISSGYQVQLPMQSRK